MAPLLTLLFLVFFFTTPLYRNCVVTIKSSIVLCRLSGLFYPGLMFSPVYSRILAVFSWDIQQIFLSILWLVEELFQVRGHTTVPGHPTSYIYTPHTCLAELPCLPIFDNPKGKAANQTT